MKYLGVVILVFGLTVTSLFGQNTADQVRSLAESKDYPEAAKLLPEALKENWKNTDFVMLAGDIYQNLDDYKKALEMFQRAEDLEGDEPYILRKIGTMHSLLGEHKKALEVLKEAVDEDEDDVYSHLALADAFIRADSLSKAELEITRAKDINSDIPEPWVALGDLYFAQRVYELAKNNYEKALAIDEDLVEARLKLATSYYWLANREADSELRNEYFSRALKEYNRVTKQNPKNANAFFQQGKILYFAARYPTAAQAFYEYVKLRPEGYLGRWYLSQALYEVGKCDSAAPHLEVVAQNIDSVKTKARFLLARCYFDNGQDKKAEELYTKLSESETLDLKDMQRWGRSAFNMGDTARALDIYQETIEMYPGETCRLMLGIGKTLIPRQEYDRAIYLLRKRVTTPDCQNDRDVEAYYWLGRTYFLAADAAADSLKPMKLDSAEWALKEAVATDSTYLNSYVYLGDVYAAQENYDAAVDNFEYAIEQAGQDTTDTGQQIIKMSYSKLAGIKLDQKKYSELVRIGLKWIDLQPEEVFPYIYTAVGYQGQAVGDNAQEMKAKACEYYNRALRIDPKNKIANQNRNALGC